MEEKIIYESNDEFLITQIAALLEDNKITYIRKDLGCGSYLNMFMGATYSTKQLLVSEEDYDKAKKLIELFENTDFELPDELKEEEEN